jgi:hypothetical protein
MKHCQNSSRNLNLKRLFSLVQRLKALQKNSDIDAIAISPYFNLIITNGVGNNWRCIVDTRVYIGLRFYLHWILVCAIGWSTPPIISKITKIIGGYAGQSREWSLGGGNVLLLIIIGTIVGFLIGFMQYLVLRHYISRLLWWVLADVGAIAIFGMAAGTVKNFETLGLVVFAAIIVIGLIQWFVLRDQVAHSGWWILINLIGWLAGLGIESNIQKIKNSTIGLVISWPIGGTAFGIITGVLLVWMLRSEYWEEDELFGYNEEKMSGPRRNIKSPFDADGNVIVYNLMAIMLGCLVAAIFTGIIAVILHYLNIALSFKAIGGIYIGVLIATIVALFTTMCPNCYRLGGREAIDKELISEETRYRKETRIDTIRDNDGHLTTIQREVDVPVKQYTYRNDYRCRVCGHTWQDISMSERR